NGGAEASDLCGNGVTWSNNTATAVWAGTCTQSITIEFYATDDCGNTATTTAMFTITDTTAPAITTEASDDSSECQGTDPDANTDYIAWLAANGGAEASDLCGNGVTWSNSTATAVWTGTCTQSITVEFYATDDCGNTSTTTATFTIEDTTAPSIDVAAADQTVECDGAGNTAALDAWLLENGGAEASDVCGNV